MGSGLLKANSEGGRSNLLHTPVWRSSVSVDTNDPTMLRIQAGPSAVAAIADRADSRGASDVEQVDLRFENLINRTQALQCIEVCRARELRRLLMQLNSFADCTL